MRKTVSCCFAIGFIKEYDKWTVSMSLKFRKYITISCVFATCDNLWILRKVVKLFMIKLSFYLYDHADH